MDLQGPGRPALLERLDRVRIAGPVGDDAAAAVFEAHFRREGVDPSGLVRVPGACSSVSAVIVDARGERLIVNRRGDALLKAPDFEASQVDDADILLTDPRCAAWAEAALTRARSIGRVAVLDGDTAPRADLQRLVGLATWAVFSEPGLAAFDDAPPEAALDAALRQGAEVAVLTRGEHGLLWRRRGGPLQQMAAFAVAPVVDTVAAGDTFHGALAVALGAGAGDEAALRWASAAAALKCARAGGVLGAPTREELLQRLAAGGPP